MKRQNMIWVFGILFLCLVAAVAFGERPSRKPTSRPGSKGMAREPGTLSRAHLSSSNSRTSRPSPNSNNNRNSFKNPKIMPQFRKSPDTRFSAPTKNKKPFQPSHRRDKESSQKNRYRPESWERTFDRNYHRDDRDHNRRPPRTKYYHRYSPNYYAPRYYHPDYTSYGRWDYRKPKYGFSFSLGTNWNWSSYDSFYSNYSNSGLNWGLSYGSDDYWIYVSSGNTTYSNTYQVWIPGYWETVNDRVTDIGPNGVVCWRYVSHQVWKPGYWKVCYR